MVMPKAGRMARIRAVERAPARLDWVWRWMDSSARRDSARRSVSVAKAAPDCSVTRQAAAKARRLEAPGVVAARVRAVGTSAPSLAAAWANSKSGLMEAAPSRAAMGGRPAVRSAASTSRASMMVVRRVAMSFCC